MADFTRIPPENGIQTPLPASVPAEAETEAQTDPRYRISLIKGEERWNFRWEPGGESLLINRVAEMARDPHIPFDWFDAAVVCRHIAQPFGGSSNRRIKR